MYLLPALYSTYVHTVDQRYPLVEILLEHTSMNCRNLLWLPLHEQVDIGMRAFMNPLKGVQLLMRHLDGNPVLSRGSNCITIVSSKLHLSDNTKPSR